MKMERLLPRSLVGRVALVLFVGLAAAQLLSFWLVVAERGMAMRGMMLNYLARDVANAVAVLDAVPQVERAAWLARLDKPSYAFSLKEHTGGVRSASPLAEPVVRAVQEVVPPARSVVALAADDPATALVLQLALGDGTPLSVRLREPRLQLSEWALPVLALQLALLAFLCWLAVRLATAPLRQLAGAAAALDPARPGASLPEDGPREVASAAAAFNRMQQRIHAHLEERMQMLAAISHDLQTPITRLRLRADLLDDATLRDKLHADLAEMQGLVEEGIAYARSAHALREPEHTVDVKALVESVAHDYTDAGQAVQLLAADEASLRSRPQALRRVICNLVDNALKFAGGVELRLERQANGAPVLRVLDRGPGIPEAELQSVLQPFYRVENSRARSTGGTGLGLAIAQQLATASNATLRLAAREGGGLEARVEFGRP
jgi:signal transduction histidine kinase